MKIVLGSSSPRRKLILESLFEQFEIFAPDIEETALPDESPVEFCKRLSEDKARSIASQVLDSTEKLIIACDTIVNIDNKIIGKPKDFEDAIKILNVLNGKIHTVISGLTLLYINNKKIIGITDAELTEVNFKSLSDKEIINYLGKFDYMDKAGAYAVQEYGTLIIDNINGSITNVIGFPIRLFFKLLSKLNLLDRIFF
ncbi:MAG: nucleoside triphosphate pyrophosphatase [Spirochaetota bacterium]